MSVQSLSKPIIKTQALSKTVTINGEELKILHPSSLIIQPKETVAIIGTSGSGKSTLLSLLAGLDLPSSGSVSLAGHALEGLSEDQRAEVRAKNVGFIFQAFMLIPSLTALENVLLPLELANKVNAKEEAYALLESVGLSNRAEHYPNQLSGGEQQRVAIARAFACKPRILFADEPTGNLDADNGEKIQTLLFEMNNQFDTTLILVTHDLALAQRCQRQLHMHSGQLTEPKTTAKQLNSTAQPDNDEVKLNVG